MVWIWLWFGFGYDLDLIEVFDLVEDSIWVEFGFS